MSFAPPCGSLAPVAAAPTPSSSRRVLSPHNSSVSTRFDSFRLVSTRFDSFRLVSTRFDSFRLVSTRFDSFRLVSRLLNFKQFLHVKRQTAKCEAHAKPMRNLYCKALLPMQCWSSRTPGCSGRSCKSVLGLNVSGCLWMSLVLCSLVLDATCPQCKNSLMPTPLSFLSFLSFLSRYQEPFAVLLPVTLPLH